MTRYHRYTHIISDDIAAMLREHYKLEEQFSRVFLLAEEEEAVAHTGQEMGGGNILPNYVLPNLFLVFNASLPKFASKMSINKL